MVEAASYTFELRLPDAPAAPSVRYRPVPAWPSIERDVALVLPTGITAAEVGRVLRKEAGALCERSVLFDEYRGRPLAEFATWVWPVVALPILVLFMA